MKKGGIIELGCIACDELGELGAGKEEWLQNNPNILVALTTDFIALANQSLALILDWNGEPSPVIIRPALGAIEGHISAMEWLVLEEDRTLALGTSQGFILIYSLAGDLLLKQVLHPSTVIRLRVQRNGGRSLDHTASNGLCVAFPDAILRIDGSALQPLLHRRLQETDNYTRQGRLTKNSPEGLENFHGKLQYQLWNVSKSGPCTDVAITGIMPPPLMEYQSGQRYYCAITVGSDTALSAYRLSEDKNKSLMGAILSKVMPATISTVTSLAKMFWWSDQAEARPTEVKPQAFARASLMTCLKDHPRKGKRLALSPGGTLAAVTDSLGRILLLDTQALVIVRLWKGYRDACCLFLEAPFMGDANSVDAVGCERSRHDLCLYLAIHAPRRGVVEVWRMRTGPRIMTLKCAKGCQLLQPACKLICSSAETNDYAPSQVYLLNGDSGQITVLNPHVHPS